MMVNKLALTFLVTTCFVSGAVTKLNSQQISYPDINKVNLISDQNNLTIENIAKNITVSIYSVDKKFNYYRASGTIVSQQKLNDSSEDYLYLVLTNRHVIDNLSKIGSLKINAVDRHNYNAQIDKSVDFGEDDLALVSFRSDKKYNVAQIASAHNIKPHAKIFVAGFPCRETGKCSDAFKFTPGEIFIDLLSKQPLKKGYQIGLTNLTENGMSGGPVINQEGQLIGIHGRGKSQAPIFISGNSKVPNIDEYIYKDGTSPSQSEKEELGAYGWAVPIDVFVKAFNNRKTNNVNYTVNSEPSLFSNVSVKITDIISDKFLLAITDDIENKSPSFFDFYRINKLNIEKIPSLTNNQLGENINTKKIEIKGELETKDKIQLVSILSILLMPSVVKVFISICNANKKNHALQISPSTIKIPLNSLSNFEYKDSYDGNIESKLPLDSLEQHLIEHELMD